MTRKGFTLIELLVVVLIMGILASVAMPQYYKSVEKSRSAEAIAALSAYASALERHYMKLGTYANGLVFDQNLSVVFGIVPEADIDLAGLQYFHIRLTSTRELHLQRKEVAGGGLGHYVMYVKLPNPPDSGKRTWGCYPVPNNPSVTCNDFLPHGGNIVIENYWASH